MEKLELVPIELPLIRKNDDLAELIINALSRKGIELRRGDVLVITSKVISKSRGYVVRLDKITPGIKARVLSKISGVPAQVIEHCMSMHGDPILLLPYSLFLTGPNVIGRISKNPEKAKKLLSEYPNMFLYRVPWGISTDCGVDFSNNPKGSFTYPPPNPGDEAESIRKEIKKRTGADVGVIITDTEAVSLRPGSLEITVGSSGVRFVNNEFAEPDLYGRPKIGGVDLIADMIANAAGLLMGQTSRGVPAVLVRGVDESFLAEETYPSEKRFPPKGLLIKILAKNLLVKTILAFLKILSPFLE